MSDRNPRPPRRRTRRNTRKNGRGEGRVLPAPGPQDLRPVHRIAVLVVVVVVVLALSVAGLPPEEAVAVMMLAGAVAAQLTSWLAGRPTAQSAGGPGERGWAQ